MPNLVHKSWVLFATVIFQFATFLNNSGWNGDPTYLRSEEPDNLKNPTPGTWHLEPDTWNLTPGTWHLEEPDTSGSWDVSPEFKDKCQQCTLIITNWTLGVFQEFNKNRLHKIVSIIFLCYFMLLCYFETVAISHLNINAY